MCEVSVIIPVYNGAEYIGGAVESALAQRGVSLEVIVVDDGSTDETPQILERFGDAIRVIRGRHAGHVAARNQAARVAAGEWLAFLDADDEWLPTKLQQQLAAAVDADLVYTERENLGATAHIARRQSESQILYEGSAFEHLILGNFITVSSVILRKDWFHRLGGFDADPYGCEDWDLWLRYSAAGGTICVVRAPLTRYRWRDDAMSMKHDQMQRGRELVVRRALASPRGRLLNRSIAARARAAAWETAAAYAALARSPKAIRWYLRSICRWPLTPRVYRQLAKCCVQMMWSGSPNLRTSEGK
jgi:glycosyltransferase involved in cell wall biosynthesis